MEFQAKTLMTTIDDEGNVHGEIVEVVDIYGENWPPRDTSIRNVSVVERNDLYGTFTYVSKPLPGNPESICITGMKNFGIERVVVPQNIIDRKVSGIVNKGVYVNEKIADQLTSLFTDWETVGLLSLVLTWDGGFAPRFVRGSKTNLSNHSWGTAFDINAQWNQLGRIGALVGDRGSVRQLVELATKNGFFWGGWFAGRPDAMHFEAGIRV